MLIKQRKILTNGIQINVAEAGKGPLVLFVHGFPESWYSWRHQIPAVASAGYHAVAMDMRGYGKSDKPSDIEAYNQVEVTKDVIGLIEALGHSSAVVFGHDWGGPTAWSCALNYPDLVSAVGVLSVPFSPRPKEPPLKRMQEIFKGLFFYQLYFQEPGVAEKEWERNIKVNLRKFFYMASGSYEEARSVAKLSEKKDLLSDIQDPLSLGAWCSEDDLDFYTKEFERSGFRGPLNYYRNHNLTWELTAGAPQEIQQPAMYAAGDRDGVIALARDALEKMPSFVKDLRANKLIPGIGHWTQQEAPDDVNRILLNFLASL